MTKYQTVTKEEIEWLRQYDEDIRSDPSDSDPYAGDMYGCWCSARSYESYQRACNIRSKIINENITVIEANKKKKK